MKGFYQYSRHDPFSASAFTANNPVSGFDVLGLEGEGATDPGTVTLPPTGTSCRRAVYHTQTASGCTITTVFTECDDGSEPRYEVTVDCNRPPGDGPGQGGPLSGGQPPGQGNGSSQTGSSGAPPAGGKPASNKSPCAKLGARNSGPTGTPLSPAANGVTSVQVLGRQVDRAPSGDLHAALLITGNGQAIVVSAQPSQKIHGWSEFENLLGIDVGITISPQTPAPPGSSGEFAKYQKSPIHDASPVVILNQSFDQTVAQVNTFNSAISSQNVPYLTRTQNSNSYAFTLNQVLTGTPCSAPSSYYGGGTWIPTPAAPTPPH